MIRRYRPQNGLHSESFSGLPYKRLYAHRFIPQSSTRNRFKESLKSGDVPWFREQKEFPVKRIRDVEVRHGYCYSVENAIYLRTAKTLRS